MRIFMRSGSRGAAIFNNLCAPVIEWDTRLVGLALSGVMERRSPEWIMNMILKPVESSKKILRLKELLDGYRAVMTDQNLSQDDVRAVLEYFRQNNEK